MPNNDALGDRMKGYENISRIYLPRRIPVIIRLDGKAFHTFTRGMQKPFDPVLTQAMQQTMKYLCENIQGCVLGYTQSDEITLVLTDYATIKTDAWFGYNIQKMSSVAASMATLAFNTAWKEQVDSWERTNRPEDSTDEELPRLNSIYKARNNKALFDARVFSIPKEEVCNCLIWRQQDATRNSIESVGQANFSHRELHEKTCNDIQEMLFSQRGINWNDYPTDNKRGSCCKRQTTEEKLEYPHGSGQIVTVQRNRWVIDHDIPIFTQQRSYVEALL